MLPLHFLLVSPLPSLSLPSLSLPPSPAMTPSGRAALLKQQPQQLRSPQQAVRQPIRQPGGGGGVETVTQGMAGLSTSTEQQMTRRGTSGKTYVGEGGMGGCVEESKLVLVFTRTCITCCCSVCLNANYVMLKGRSEGVFQYAVSFE